MPNHNFVEIPRFSKELITFELMIGRLSLDLATFLSEELDLGTFRAKIMTAGLLA